MKSLATIPLTNGGVCIVDSEQLEEFSQYTWTRSTGGYACRSVGLGKRGHRRTDYMHRIVNGTPSGFQTDHINGDKLDNRKSNLRTATSVENGRHSKKKNRNGNTTSRFKGVYRAFKSSKWVAQIRHGGKSRHLGRFDSERDAALAYNGAASLLYGDFALLNDVS